MGCLLSPMATSWQAENQNPSPQPGLSYFLQHCFTSVSQAGIKIAGRNINNLRYADDTTLMAESEQELKSLLKVKEESEKPGLKTRHSKNRDHGIQSHHFTANRWGKMETVTDFISLGSNISADGDCSHEIRRRLLLGRKAMTNLDSTLKSRTLLCQQRSIQSRLWFFQWSCMDVRVGL